MLRRPRPTSRLGLAAIEKGKATGAKTQRERDYIDALAVMYTDHDKVPHRARVQAYLKAMEALAQRYPDDDEAQIFYAHHAQRRGLAQRQDLRQPAQRRGASWSRSPNASRSIPAWRTT